MVFAKRVCKSILTVMSIIVWFGCSQKVTHFENAIESSGQDNRGALLTGGVCECNVLLITIDALRSDHLGCYDYSRNTSPVLDRLARSGILFKNCMSQAAHTHPSIASLMTGTYPRKHRSIVGSRYLSEWNLTLAEILQMAHYRTGAFVQNYWLSREMGFSQGFDDYHYLETDLSDPANCKDIENWLATGDSRPFFLWLHYLEPHAGYVPRQPFLDSLIPEYQGDRFTFTNDMLINHRAHNNTLTANELEYIEACYDSEIRWTDTAIGRIIDRLGEFETNRSTLIIVTSDHGEEFCDHGSLGHDHTLYNELLHVPLIMVSPGFLPENTIIEDVVRSIDILPTIIACLGLPPSGAAEGQSLLPVITDEQSGAEKNTFPAIAQRYFLRPSSHLVSMISDSWKIIAEIPGVNHLDFHKWSLDPELCSVRLYHLGTDPGEQTDVAGSYPEKVAEMIAMLQKWAAEGSDRHIKQAHDNNQPLSDETKEKLRSLGYLR